MLAAEPCRSRPAKPGLLRVTPRACGPVLPAAEPMQPDEESWSSPCWRSPRWRRPSCGSGAGVSGPDAQPSDQLFMLAARPGSTGHGPPSPAPSTSHCVLAVLVPPAAAMSGALHAGALHAGGVYSCGLGAGVSGPDAHDPDPLCTWAARPDWSRLAKLCLLRVAPCARGPCAARRGVLELFILVLSTLAALPAVVWELA